MRLHLWSWVIAYAVGTIGEALIIKTRDHSRSFFRVCYYDSDAVNLTPDKIDESLCTHILFAFARIRNSTLVTQTPEDIQLYEKLINLKTRAPDLKIMLSVGGGNSETGYSEMVRVKENRTQFINQSLEFIEEYGFDGLDFDWEFPGYGDDPSADSEYFNIFLKELYPVMKKSEKLVSVAVAAVLPIMDISYKIPDMAENVDFINLMSYDFHFYLSYFPFTGHNSPLFSRKHEVIILNHLNTAWSAEYWVSEGMPKSKIMVGIPTYGHTYRLLTEDQHDIAAASTGVGDGNGWTNYPQVCDFIKSGGKRIFDNESRVPYAYKDLEWKSYDDISSVTLKTKWIIEQDFGGAMIFDLNSDDWNATCDGVKQFPLIKAIRDTVHSFTVRKKKTTAIPQQEYGKYI